MDPTPLFAGLREHLPKRRPQPERAVADRHQLLGAIGAHPTITRQHGRPSSKRRLQWMPSAQQYT
jgi:hypothetical protein